jgi:hypothetical protein
LGELKPRLKGVWGCVLLATLLHES